MSTFTIDHTELARLWNADVPVKVIAAQLGVSKASVSKHAKKLGLPRRACSWAELPQREIVRVYVDHGRSIAQIADSLRPRFPTLANTTIRRILHAHGVKMRPKGHPMDRIAECVRLVRAGLECTEIARRLGMSPIQVRRRARRALGTVGKGRKPQMPVRIVVARVLSGETYAQVARDYGCTESAIGVHVRRARNANKRAPAAVTA